MPIEVQCLQKIPATITNLLLKLGYFYFILLSSKICLVGGLDSNCRLFLFLTIFQLGEIAADYLNLHLLIIARTTLSNKLELQMFLVNYILKYNCVDLLFIREKKCSPICDCLLTAEALMLSGTIFVGLRLAHIHSHRDLNYFAF